MSENVIITGIICLSVLLIAITIAVANYFTNKRIQYLEDELKGKLKSLEYSIDNLDNIRTSFVKECERFIVVIKDYNQKRLDDILDQ